MFKLDSYPWQVYCSGRSNSTHCTMVLLDIESLFFPTYFTDKPYAALFLGKVWHVLTRKLVICCPETQRVNDFLTRREIHFNKHG